MRDKGGANQFQSQEVSIVIDPTHQLGAPFIPTDRHTLVHKLGIDPYFCGLYQVSGQHR